MLSVPTVITGKNYSLHSLADSAALEVRLLFEGMPIVISLAHPELESSDEGQPLRYSWSRRWAGIKSVFQLGSCPRRR